jgi:hypothetical protein
MKYVITENQKQVISDRIYKFIDNLLPSNMTVVYAYDSEEVIYAEKMEEIDSISFLNDDYDTEMIIYLENYWNDTPLGEIKKK